jgi:hypothetical protein
MFNLVKRSQQVVTKPTTPAKSLVLSGSDGDFEIQLKRPNSTGLVRSPKKEIMINKEKHQVDAYQLIRMIRNVTQQIGEYKNVEHTYAAYVIPSLRKARNDMASDLVKHFGIHWSLEDGNSVFWIG